MSGTQTIVGLSSGLDTDEIVDQMIELERGNAVLLESEVEYKTSVITAYNTLEAYFLSLSTQVSSLSRSSTFNDYSVTVTDDDYLTATSTSGTTSGSYDIQVLSLARNHQIASQGFDDVTSNDLGTGTITLQIGDGAVTTITVDSTNNSLADIKNAINDADMGISATLVNDGTDSNAYRLVLSGDNTGRKNKIDITCDLSGGLDLNFDTGSFDVPETYSSGTGTTAEVSLGASASYTGSENKTYTFTVGGTGEQTIGTDTITINWTDGTNSGSFEVSAGDTEVTLTGDGADGLTLSFSDGIMTAGDEFTVSTFTPLLQEATDAKITLGSAGGTGSPITVTSTTNTFKNVIDGVTLTTKKVTGTDDSVTVQSELDISTIEDTIESFIDAYNEVVEFIDDQNTYDEDEETTGILFGETSVWSMQMSLRSIISGTIEGITSKYNQLYTIGIHTQSDGTLEIDDSSKLQEALNNNLEDVINLFVGSGESSKTGIEFMSSTALTQTGEPMEVDITQAATQGSMTGSVLTTPSISPIEITSSYNTFRLKVDGLNSEEITLTEGTYNSISALIDEIQAGIDADENIGGRGIEVEWVDTGGNQGYIKVTSGTYGSNSTVSCILDNVSNDAYSILGWSSATSDAGLDVEGTINGEECEGVGQYLTALDSNETTSGLKLLITLTEEDLVDGAEGTITPTKGVAAKLDDLIDSLTDSTDGVFARKVAALQTEIEDKEERIEEIDERLEIRRETLTNEFTEMETILSELDAEQEYLETQIDALNSNWSFNSSD
ncbi:MAG TPA: flagellar filament capping protein FliD [candidate division Zixibacteria bacterium]|nr:flagellar filament capping protein FliD [candidate division Zixibacteria bacterium]